MKINIKKTKLKNLTNDIKSLRSELTPRVNGGNSQVQGPTQMLCRPPQMH